MEKFIEYEKLSKKEKKKANKAKRTTWSDFGDVNPVSRAVPDKKKQSDKRSCRGKRKDGQEE